MLIFCVDSVVLKTAFKVGGFTVRGRVITRKGEGIPGVAITVSGVSDSVTTDSEGYYRLAGITSGNANVDFPMCLLFLGTYQIKASKQHYQFSEFKEGVKISPSEEIAPILLSHLDLCGSLSFPTTSSTDFSASDRVITVTDTATGEKVRFSNFDLFCESCV